jgi:hypothetical protein
VNGTIDLISSSAGRLEACKWRVAGNKKGRLLTTPPEVRFYKLAMR